MIHTTLSRGAGASWLRLPILLLLVLLLASTLLSFNTGGRAHATQVVSGNHIASIAEGQVGGNCWNYYNCPNPGAWCADFARWVWSQAGVDISSLNSEAASFYDYGRNNGTLSNTPQVGDAVVYGYDASHDHALHVALVTNVDTGHHTIMDVGGNENNTVQEDGPYDWTVGGSPTGQVISGYIAPVGLANAVGGTRGSSQVVSQSDGTLDTFYESSDGALGHDYYVAGSGWYGPYEMPGTAPMGSEPSAVTSRPGVVDVFWKGTDGNLWHDYNTGSGWSAAQRLGYGPLGGPPEAVAAPDGTIGVFWKGATGDIWDAWYTPSSGWSGGPHKLTSNLNPASDPSPITDGNGTWDVFWKGADGTLWHVYSNTNGSTWTSQNLGDGTLGGAPRAVAQADGTIGVFWQGTGGADIWDAWYTPGSGWSGPHKLTSNLQAISDPAPVNSRAGTWDVFWQGANGDLWHVYSNTNGSTWTSQDLGDGTLGGGPFATGQSDGTIDVFWKGSSPATLWHAWFNPGSGWGGPQNLGGSVA